MEQKKMDMNLGEGKSLNMIYLPVYFFSQLFFFQLSTLPINFIAIDLTVCTFTFSQRQYMNQ